MKDCMWVWVRVWCVLDICLVLLVWEWWSVMVNFLGLGWGWIVCSVLSSGDVCNGCVCFC